VISDPNFSLLQVFRPKGENLQQKDGRYRSAEG
jgi:hypothetical protein